MKRKRLFIAIGSFFILAGIATFAFWPFTTPWLIKTKIRILGPRLVYSPLAYDDDLWEIVLKGVRSGDVSWLQVAADLRPALDTHPGEEMLGAVSVAIDRNPMHAINILIPTYGAKIVCGENEEGGQIGREKAEQREQLLKHIEPNTVNQLSLNACRQALTLTATAK